MVLHHQPENGAVREMTAVRDGNDVRLARDPVKTPQRCDKRRRLQQRSPEQAPAPRAAARDDGESNREADAITQVIAPPGEAGERASRVSVEEEEPIGVDRAQ